MHATTEQRFYAKNIKARQVAVKPTTMMRLQSKNSCRQFC